MKTITRSFVEEMMRLRRDVSNFNELKIEKELKLELNENDYIGFDPNTKFWTVESEYLKSDSWNPKISEVVTFLNNYSDNTLFLAIENLQEKIIEGYEEVNAKALRLKFLRILDLLTLDGNGNCSIEVPYIKENIMYTISYISKDFIYNKSNSKEIHTFNTEVMDKLLENVSYHVCMSALNDCYGQLKVKKIDED